MTIIALFPVPGCVAFPGTKFTLHVFEPRYRTMVKQCADQKQLLGLCHTKKIVHEAKTVQNTQEALASNRATYKPCEVFSAGLCEITEELKDGRFSISVQLQKRYLLKQELQTLPFSVYDCDSLDDIETADTHALAQAKEKLLMRLSAMTVDMPEVYELLQSESWQQKDPVDFSFEIFGVLRLDGDILQMILEHRNPLHRLQEALNVLNQ